jgi:4-amino-4-deoxy-L-arabinose transferase-like glycosyltransferase
MVEKEEIIRSAKRKIGENREFVLLASVYLVVQFYILFRTWSKPLVWDAAIYTAMGKNLFSMGQYGLWEVFRPPVLPLISGVQWLLGIPALGFSRLVSVIISFASLSTVYLAVNSITDRKMAVMTSAILASTFYFSRYSSMYLTGIAASGLVFLSLYLVWRKKLVTGGVVGGLAFLTRFPSALVGPAAVIYLSIRYYRDRDLRGLVENSAKYTGGFMALAVPYFLLNWHFFGGPLEPITRGVAVPAANPDRYLAGVFYLYEAVKVNPVHILVFPGIYWLYRSKRKVLELVLPAFLIFYGFFSFFPHKEARFMLLFLPLMSFLSAAGLRYILEKVEPPVDARRLVLAGLLVGVAVTGVMTAGIMTPIDQDSVEYYSQHSELEGLVASNDASIMAYGDFRYLPLPPAELETAYPRAQEEADYFSLNSCAWYCPAELNSCQQVLGGLEEDIRRNYTATFELNTSNCNFGIYRIGDQD